MASVEESWNEATESLDADVCESWLSKLRETYSEERRTYHNLDSVGEKLEHYAEIKDCLKNPKAVLLALFFQNFEYDPKAMNEENKNLEHFNAFAEEAGLPANLTFGRKKKLQKYLQKSFPFEMVFVKDSDIATQTQELLIAASTHSTEAHKVGGAYGGEDAHYLLDLDMAVLGAEADKYADYRDKIRGEYSFLSEPMYTALRLKVLQNFLQIPNIFATRQFREKYEEQARANIQSEIELLS